MPAPRRAPAALPACRSAAAVAVFLVAAGIALAADLYSKHWAFETLLADPACRRQMVRYLGERPDADSRRLLHFFRRDLVPGVRLSLSTNPGVVFGLGVPRWIVNLATGGAILLVAGMFAWSDRRARATHLGLALILAGAAGNLYDRLFSVVQLPLPGLEPIRRHVRDFIDCSQLHYPYVFNVADAWLVIGVALLMLQWVLQARRDRAARKADGQPA